jgi:hypothetical protein
VIVLPLPPECWDYRHVTPYPDSAYKFLRDRQTLTSKSRKSAGSSRKVKPSFRKGWLPSRKRLLLWFCSASFSKQTRYFGYTEGTETVGSVSLYTHIATSFSLFMAVRQFMYSQVYFIILKMIDGVFPAL